MKEYPYINRFTGDVKMLPKSEGKKLNEDWEQPKVVRNDKGERVFRFQIATPVIGPDGKPHAGVATVDISEMEAKNGNRSAK